MIKEEISRNHQGTPNLMKETGFSEGCGSSVGSIRNSTNN